ncbi:MAG: cell wall surface anchored protein [Parcubacteria group bacterium Gr01-1014_8]|nr:MAG: cell wall surface anchored protein [Parcubacteria group bacterium Gr01-1014_8]
MSDEIFFDGVRYISAQEAATSLGFSRDYIARLARIGKVKGRQIGKNWYVEFRSVQTFVLEQEYLQGKRRKELAEKRVFEYRKQVGSTDERSSDIVAPVIFADAVSVSAKQNKRHAAIKAMLARAMSRRADLKVLAHANRVHTPSFFSVTPAVEFLHKLTALITAFVLTFGAYAFVNADYAHFALDSIRSASRSVVAVPKLVWGGDAARWGSDTGAQLAAVALQTAQSANQAESSITSFMSSAARNFNLHVNDLLYGVIYPNIPGMGSFAFSSARGRVDIQIVPYRSDAPAARSAPAPLIRTAVSAPTTVINQPIVERIRETKSVVTLGGISEELLASKLLELDTKLSSRMLSLTSSNATSITQVYNTVGQMGRIEHLDDLDLTNPTITRGTLTNVRISSLSAPLTISDGGTGTSSAPTYGKVLLGNSSGAYDLVATSSLGVGGTPGGSSTQVQFNDSGAFGADSTFTFNSTSNLLSFSSASSSLQSIFDRLYVGGTATTTIFGSATSTFGAGIETTALNVTSNSASSTFANGISLSAGCFRDASGACLQSATFAYLFPSDATTTKLTFSGGLISLASTTIGNGTQAGGLTISGGATTTGNLLVQGNATTTNLAVSGTASSSALVASNSFTFSNITGFLKATAGVVATAAINLASDITGILPAGNGGTGWGNIAANTIVLGNGTGAIATTSAGTNGQMLALVSGVPTWTATTTFSAPLVFFAGNVSIAASNGSTDGYLTSADWTLFNNKVSSSSLSTFTAAFKDWNITTNTFGQSSLAPTTTQNIAVTGVGTSTFAGGLEAWRQIGAPYFNATSSSATSTFAGGLNVLAINQTGSATSTFANGLQLSNGCIRLPSGSCLASVANSSIDDLSDVTITAAAYGDLLMHNGTAWVDTATSSLGIFISDTVGTLAVGRGGTGLSSTPTYGQLLVGNASSGYTLSATSTLGIALSDTIGTLAATRGGTGLSSITNNQLLLGGAGNTVTQIATSSLNLLTTDIIEGSRLFYTDNRVDTYIHGSTTIPKTYTANTFTGANTFNSTFTLGTLNGPLHANAGVVGATTSVLAIYGGTGQTSYSTGDILYASGAAALSKLGIGGAGEVLKISGGVPTWGTDLTSGGGADGTWSTTTSQVSGTLINYPNNASDIVAIGSTATTSAEYWFDPNTTIAYLSGKVGISTTSPYSKLTLWGSASLFEAVNTSSTTIFSIGQSGATTTNLGISGIASSLLKTTSTGGVVAAIPDTDYLNTASSIELLGDVAAMTENYGDLLYWNGSAWADLATSSLGIAISDTTGTLAVARGGTGQTTFSSSQLLYGNGTNALSSVATSSLSAGTGVTFSGTAGSLVGGTALTINTPWTISGNNIYNNNIANAAIGTSTPYATTTIWGNTASKIFEVVANASSTVFSVAQSGATTTNLGITGVTNSLLKTTSTGGVVAAVAGTDYATLSQTFGKAWEIDGNGFTGFLAPTTTQKVWIGQASSTLLSVNGPAYFGSTATSSFSTAGVLTLATDLAVTEGGTGASTLTGLLQGNGTSAFTAITDSSTVGQILRVTGASTYAWGALNLADTDAITGTLPISNGGTNNTTYSTNALLYFDGTSITATSTRPLYVGAINATTTATSTFAGGISVLNFAQTGTATSTLANGLTLTGGCVMVNGNCISPVGNSSIEDLNDVAAMTENYGDLLGWNGSTWTDFATTSLFTGSNGQMLAYANGGWTGVATTTAGTGLTYTGSAFNVDLGTSISAAEIADGDHGDFTYTSGVAAIDANAVTLGTDTTGNYVATLADSGGGTLTISNSGSETAAVTASLNLGNANIWTGKQNFFGSASSTLFSANWLKVGQTASTTFDSAGNATIGGTLNVTGQTTLATSLTGLLKATAGVVSSATEGTDYLSNALRDWSVQGNGYLAPTTTRGIIVVASSTIGAGGQATGLTISGGATTTGNAYFAGNVGVGTAAPSQKLQVVNGAIDINTDDQFLYFGSGDAGIRESGANLKFETYTGAALTEKMRITGAGNVGIGTTTPATLLSIAGTSGLFASTTATSTFQGGGINLLTAAGNTGCFAVNGTCLSNTASGIVGSGTTGQFPYYAANGTTLTATSTLFVSTASNVGIGATSPAAKLDVEGSGAVLTDIMVGNSQANANFGISAAGVPHLWTNNASWPLVLGVGGAEKMRVHTDGNVGIGAGATGPGALLTVDSGAASLTDILVGNSQANANFGISAAGVAHLWSNNSSWPLAFGIGAAENMRIHTNGNVGLGNTSPSYKLDVAGFINTDQFSGYKQNGTTILYSSSTLATMFGGYQAGNGQVQSGTGLYNTAFGYQALLSATSSSRSTAVGFSALASQANANGNDARNTAVGSQALGGTTYGYYNTAVGSDALAANTTGYFNSAFGQGALTGNTTGRDNIAIGYNSVSQSTAALENIGIGNSSLSGASLTGADNIAIGRQAGSAMSSGSYNILIGQYLYNSGTVFTGSNNIIIGRDIGSTASPLVSTTTSNALNIGNLIFATSLGTADTLSTGNVGIGTAAPNYQLSNNSASNNLDSGSTGLSTASSFNWANNGSGYGAGLYNASANSDANGLLVKIRGTASTNKILSLDTGTTQAGAGTNVLTVLGSGNVGIGTTSPRSALYFQANSSDPSLTSWTGIGTMRASTGVELAMGADDTTPFGAWLQTKDSTNGGTSYPLLLNPLGGNVGIGTTTPQTALHVNGILAATPSYGFYWYNGATFKGALKHNSSNDNLEIYTASDGSTPRLTVQSSSGNVGIGTTSPVSILAVAGANPVLTLNQTSSGNVSGLKITNGVNTLGTFTVAIDTGEVRIGGTSSGGYYDTFYADGSERMRITAAGNVGIGTTTPQWLLNPTSASASQLALSAGAGIAQWTFRNAGGNLYLSTTTVAGTATTSISALEIAGGGLGTTTVRGLNISAGATSTSNVGFSLTSGCFATPAGCISGVGDSSIEALNDVAAMTKNFGDLLYWNGTTWTDLATSSLAVNFSDLIGSATDAQVTNALTISGGVISGTNTVSGTWNTTNTLTIGNGGDRIDVNSSGWDVTDSVISGATYQGNTIGTTYGGTNATGFSSHALLAFNGTSIVATSTIGFQSFNATSTTATSTIAGGLAVETSGLVYDYSTNRVGIGTASPSNKLHIASSANDSTLFIQQTSGTQRADIRIDNDGGYMLIGRENSAGGSLAVGSTGYFGVMNVNNAYGLQFGTNNTVRATIDSSGNVGIGTTSPATSLSVSGSGYLTGALGVGAVATGFTNLLVNDNSNTAHNNDEGIVVKNTNTGSSAGASINLRNDGTYHGFMQMNSGANTSLAGANSFNIGAEHNINFGFITNDALQMTLNTTGLGIGNTSPSYKLDVAGFINTDQFSGYKQAGNTILYASSTNATVFGGQGAGSAMQTSGTGAYNTAFGYGALTTATSSSRSTAIGFNALANQANSNGNDARNTAVGSDSLAATTYGYYNVGVGASALTANTTGAFNVALGVGALQTATSTNNVTAIGYNALGAMICCGPAGTTPANVVVGHQVARQATTAYGITGIGYGALDSLTTGHDIVALGSQAGHMVTTGTNSIFLGDLSGFKDSAGANTAITGDNNIIIGNNQLMIPNAAGSNQLNIGNLIFGTSLSTGATVSTGNVGIGTTSPRSILHAVAGASGVLPNAGTTFTMESNTANYLSMLTASNAANGILFGTPTSAIDAGILYNSNGSARDLQFRTGVNNTRMTIDSTGNVGIGTTTPFRKLSITDAVSTAQQAIAYDSTRWTDLLTDSVGDLTINPQGDDVFLNADNLWVCTGGSCPSGTPAGTGNLIVETKLGVASSTPFATLGVKGSAASTAYTFMTTNSSDSPTFNIQDNGNVGIGTTTPTKQFSISSLLYVGAGGATGMGTATSTFQGDIKIIGKLDVGTIDPVYTIDGTKYATYGHSTVGIKEEVTAKLAVNEYDEARDLYRTTIRFDELEKGSDLWLFYEITRFGLEWEHLVVNLTPAFDGRVFYEEDIVENSLTIYADKSGFVSARLIADRFDAETWPNIRPDQDGNTEGTHNITSKLPGGVLRAAATATEAVSSWFNE